MVGIISAIGNKKVSYKFIKLLISHGNDSIAIVVPMEFIKKYKLTQGDLIVGEITGIIRADKHE